MRFLTVIVKKRIRLLLDYCYYYNDYVLQNIIIPQENSINKVKEDPLFKKKVYSKYFPHFWNTLQKYNFDEQKTITTLMIKHQNEDIDSVIVFLQHGNEQNQNNNNNNL